MTTPITTIPELEALPEQAVIRDRFGDVGIVQAGYVHYPETDPQAFQRVMKWEPLTVLWPLPAPTVKPGRDAVLAALLSVEAGPSTNALADAVLAILPGKSEAAVMAPAWDLGMEAAAEAIFGPEGQPRRGVPQITWRTPDNPFRADSRAMTGRRRHGRGWPEEVKGDTGGGR